MTRAITAAQDGRGPLTHCWSPGHPGDGEILANPPIITVMTFVYLHQ